MLLFFQTARQTCRPGYIIILPSVISSFLTWDKLSQDLLDRFSRSFHQMKGICMNFIDPDLFLIPLGTLPWQPILGKICKMTYIQHAGISQWIRISQFRFQGNNGHYFLLLFVQFWWRSVHYITPKISQGVSVPFGTKRQKSTYHTKYLSKYWTELRQLFSIDRRMYTDYKTEINFAVVEYLWKTLTLGLFLQTSKLTIFTLCSGISKQNETSLCKCVN